MTAQMPMQPVPSPLTATPLPPPASAQATPAAAGPWPPEIGALWLASLLLLWWLGHQFLDAAMGDGQLYTGEALRQLWPANFVQDPFFMGATQGQFTLFGPVYAWVVEWLGVRPAGLWVAFTGRLLWVVAAVLALRRCLELGTQSGAALALVLLLPSTYDGLGQFAYGETVVTPRCWAEAMVLLALERHGAGRRAQAAGALLVATALHPLMALPAWAWALGMAAWGRRPTWVLSGAALAVAGVLALAVAGLGPFGGLLQRFDEAWWRQVVVIAGPVLVQAWPAAALAKAVCWLGLLGWAAWRHPNAGMRRAAQVLWLVAVLLLAAWVAASFSRHVLGVQLQLWRVLWLVQLLAPALWLTSLPPWRKWDSRLWAHAGLVMTAVLSGGTSLTLMVWPALALLSPAGAWLWRSTLLRRCCLAAVAVMALMMLAVRWPMALTVWYQHRLNEVAHAAVVAVVAEPALTLLGLAGLTALAWRLATRWPRAPALVAAALVLPLLAVALDVQHNRIRRAVVGYADGTALRAAVPAGAVVYWDKGVVYSWMVLQRAHYAGPNQGATTLFSREAAMEFQRRYDRLAALGVESPMFTVDPPAKAATRPDMGRAMTLDKISVLCQDPVLTHVLVTAQVPEADVQVPFEDSEDGQVSVFRCRR